MSVQCRSCLNNTADQYVDMETSMLGEVSYLQYFAHLTQLEAAPGDGLPSMMCSACAYDLQVAYDFVTTARQADAALRENMHVRIENESISEQDTDFDRLEYMGEVEELDECEGEEFLDEESEMTHVEVTEIEPVGKHRENSLELDATTSHSGEQETDIVIVKQEPLAYPEDESDDQYLIEYQEEAIVTTLDEVGAKVGPTRSKWKCVQCKLVLRGDVSFEGHMNMHLDVRPYQCIECFGAFRCKYTLERHVEERHQSKTLATRFNCEFCGQTFFLQTLLNEHQRQAHIMPYTCKKCAKSYDTVTELNIHNKLVHSSAICTPCPFCEDTMLKHVKLGEHFRTEHPDEHTKYFPTVGRPRRELSKSSSFQCDICECNFRSAAMLRDHRRTHLNGQPHECKTCNKRFASPHTLRIHMRALHPVKNEQNDNQGAISDTSVVTCEICKKQLLRRNLEKHFAMHRKKDREANEAKKFFCSVCLRKFKTQKSVNQHEKMHDGESPGVVYLCDCGRQYASQYLLEHHRKQAHKERDNVCEICGNAFKLKNQLVNHMKLHLEKNIACPHCDKKYARPFDLNVHLRTHTGELPFACHLCEKRFAIKVRLTYHLQKHMGVKHRCKECDAEFNSKQKLKAHSYKHTGMPYRCQHCDGHGFANRDVFKRHLYRVHSTTMTDEALAKMFQQNTGKTTRVRPISELNQELQQGFDELEQVVVVDDTIVMGAEIVLH